MPSLWSGTVTLPSFPPLQDDLNIDVLIIGGGLAGLLCCHFLTGAGVDCALVEAKTLCSGATGGTTAKVTAQHGLIYQKIEKEFGSDAARLYYEANEAALNEYRNLCAGRDCDFEEQDSYIYSREDRAPLDRELKALERARIPAAFVEGRALPLPFPTVGAVKFTRQAKFHPLKFAAALAPGLPIYENTPVLEFQPGMFRTPKGYIRAKTILVCTHFPMFNKHGSYFLKLYQDRSYALALEGAGPIDGMFLDQQKGGLSLRSWGDTLILGAGGHRPGKPGTGWTELSSLANRFYPGKKELCRWAAQDCMTLDGMPYIGRYSSKTPSLFVATGFNKWGMTSAMAAAMVLTDLILGRENPYAPLFSPQRTVLRPQLAINGLEAMAGWLTFKRPRCPHMGCALQWNSRERSWDCPCHGSRFAEDGKLLDNPATGDLS